MNNNLQKLINEAKLWGLTVEERNGIRRNLLAFMESNPQGVHGFGAEARVSNWHVLFTAKPVALFLSIILILTGSTSLSFAAENSLPGEILYPVKVNIIEEVRSALASSTETKAKWESERMAVRLEEAEALANNGQLTPKLRAEIEYNFEKHAQRVDEHVAKLEDEGNVRAVAQVSSNLEVSLEVHQAILENLADQESAAEEIDNGVIGQSEELLIKIEEKKDFASLDRQDSEEKVYEQPTDAAEATAQAGLQEAEKRIVQVQDFIYNDNKSSKSSADFSLMERSRARLLSAKQILDDGKVKLEAKDYAEAFVLFQAADRAARRAQLIMETKNNLDIEIELDDDPTVLDENESNAKTETDNNSEVNAVVGDPPSSEESSGSISNQDATANNEDQPVEEASPVISLP
ncbi:MAG: hypothetical protein A3A80_02465 [Candidatus Terrybacteria bacterium RIFCSPLOWO2_01_FULL_44_24]|uniref:DUF5667 domain-containing protein n=1 Tax=Candidatus Terrybacteria bacterium RIFCSPHIGHO2_01_FULL_43_35 TaxID=1802361 RepID=A0A1G2PEC7_9BACT|nr:MAG: hypothetical protein A2828_02260 [Candidatus Terrybacteria bacterium RIFCSPHIGHO2_01_FULL_43_35]OHA50309.1 MAG: hypothetical protein A3B75_00735 [Candidatus Terrybacteria bacterium RIFCSPHIGHO2_02_FULL_43_14]OHA50937.1 MAG: hypothetical protein A3A80_02465 [Candidatus Terrybacteria bacterium RIFCSPLOWO2_01_FULL_44_24]